MCPRCSRDYLNKYITKMPNANIILKPVITDEKFDGDVILIANKISDVYVNNGRVLSFANHYHNVHLAPGYKSEIIIFVCGNFEANIFAADEAHVNVTFLFESINQKIKFQDDPHIYNVDEFVAKFAHNVDKDNFATVSYQPVGSQHKILV